ncbi:MAG TPA: hypothetical protein DEF00_02520 [Candidatus Taylorbacteria bacterium]|nr:MAG: hypothetical protein UY03_C0017G0009 [Parcubacteria group bacterium GW2011_GWA2_47_64]KKU96274.1 MAG: hypothetical protein UY29_C0014G0010 [Parcubacteria group bacterium GW2011_GWC2_48_17]HBV01248.1 hypothetical protein [Candidatus Taylorbacteria bacterium]
MFNLLPKAKKDIIHSEYRIRLAVVSLWFLFFIFIFSSMLFIPSLLLSSAKERAAQERFAALSKSVERNGEAELDAALNEAKSRLALLSSETPKMFLHELLMLIVSVKTDRISLTNFSFIRSADGKREIAISGVGEDRTALLSFIKALENTNLFEKVNAPISNFVKDTDINFEIRASVAF